MLALFSLVVGLFVSLVSAAITVNTPSNWSSGETATATWTSVVGDPSSFSLELRHPSFNQDLALGNNLDTSTGTFTFTLPQVPAAPGYTLLAVNITNITQIFGQSGAFSIAAGAPNATTSSTSSGSLPTSASTSSTTSTSSGTTVSQTRVSASSSSSSSASRSSPAPSPSTFGGSGAGAATGMSIGWVSWVLTGAAVVLGGVLAF